MNREFLINIFFLIGINLLIKPIYIFGIDLSVQNAVGTEEYGLYFALFNFTFLLQIINDFGIQNFNSRQISQHNHLLDQYLPNILILKTGLGFLYLFFVFLAAWFSGYDLEVYHLLLLVALNQILVSFIFYLRSNIAGLAMYRIDSILSATDKLLMIFICGFLLFKFPGKGIFQIEWFVYAQLASRIVTALIAFVIIRKQLVRLVFKFDPAFLFLLLKKSYPFALVIFLMTAYTRIDAVMIERFLPDGKYEAGVYASGYRLLDAISMLGFLFAGLLLPMFSKMIKDGESIEELLRMSLQLIWAGAIPLSISVYFYKEKIIFLLYDEATYYWSEILGYLMISFIAITGIHIVGTLLTANKSLKKMNIIFIVSIVINILLNYILIFKYKAAGAAMATVFTQFVVLLAQLWLAKKEFDLKSSFLFLFRIMLYTATFYIFNFWLYTNGIFDWKVKFILSILVGISLALPFKLLNFSMFTELVSGKK